jgi:hypothetical protein
MISIFKKIVKWPKKISAMEAKLRQKLKNEPISPFILAMAFKKRIVCPNCINGYEIDLFFPRVPKSSLYLINFLACEARFQKYGPRG